jgi:ABC-type nitrate/sulfonate/bicarbonate transport system substrate-binding protein
MNHLTGARHFFLPGRPLLLILGVLVLLAAACGGGNDDDGAATSVTFMAGFKPQANLPFVGVYVAQEKGFFAEQGLDVNIQHATQGEHVQLLLAGEVQFATANAASLLRLRADPGADLVSIALIGQKGEQGFAVGADSGIETPADWQGKVFGYKGSVPPEFNAIAEANSLDPATVEQVRVGFDPRILSEGQVDILAVFISNEPDTLDKMGYPVRVFDPNEYDIPALGLTYMTTGAHADEDPETVEKFLKAVLKGLDYAATNREEALDIVMEYAPEEDRDHQAYMLGVELDRALTGIAAEHGIGWQTAEQWQALHDSLVEHESIAAPIDVAAAYRTEFLEAVYDENAVLVWP